MRDKDKWIRLVVVLGISSMIIGASIVMIQLLYPFLFALIFAFIINPIVNVLTRYIKLSRGLAVFITMISLISGIGVCFFFLSVEIISGIKFLMNIIPSNFEIISATVTQFTSDKVLPLFSQLSSLYNEMALDEKHSVMEQIEKMKNGALNGAISILDSTLHWILNFIQSIPNLTTSFLFGLLGTFFICKDWHKLKTTLMKLLPERVKRSCSAMSSGLKDALLGYIKAQIILIIITIVLLFVGLLILRVEHALTVSLLIGLVDLLPYVGTSLVLIPWSIYCFMTGDTFLGIGLATIYLVLVTVRHLIEPKILSSSIGLEILPTLISMYVGVCLFGIFGLIIGPVTLVIIYTCIRANIFKDIWEFIQNGKETESGH